MSGSDDAASNSWEELIVADRMAADREFQERVRASSLSNQAWGLVMMAIEFEIEQPEQPDQAHIAVNSEQLGSVLPAMKEVDEQLPHGESSSDSGLLDSVRDLFGSGRSDDDRRDEAEQLAREYAQLLRRQLEENGKWEQVCAHAADTA